MKKILSVLLCVIMLFGCMVISSSAAEGELKVLVVNDLHLDLADATAEKVKKRNNVSVEYAHTSSSGQLPYESIAIIKAFLEDAKSSDSNIVLMPGDLTTVGTSDEHEAFVALIKDFEVKTGKNVYVIPGNHDLFNSSVEEFEAFYADFGYNEAIAKDDKTASYVAELGNGYRLLAIDSTVPGQSVHGVDQNLISWVKAQCDVARAEGKKLVAIMHHNLTEHMPFVKFYYPTGVVSTDSYELADTLADGGVKFIFTGHTHDHDIAKYTSPNGNVLYDSVTTALNAYPCAYREVTFGEEVRIKTRYVTSVDTSLFPAGIHEDAMALAESNFPEYAKNSTYLGIKLLIGSFTSSSSIKKLIKVEDEEFKAILDLVIDKAAEIIHMPLYTKYETEAGKSIESIGAKLGVELPETEYETFVNLLVVLYQAHAEGDENYPAYTDEMILLQRCLAVILNYSLADLKAADYARVLAFAADLLNIELSGDVVNLVGGALEKFKGNELLLTTAIMPALVQFSVDEAPADRAVTLPGYGSDTTETTFLEELLAFFKKVGDFFLSLFAMFL